MSGSMFFFPKRGFSTEQFTASGSFVVPAGVTTMMVTICGGGGAGASGSPNFAGGGGGGGAVYDSIIATTPGETISITIGAGGSGTVTDVLSNVFGGRGGETRMVSLAQTLVAPGGYGGESGTAGGTSGSGGRGLGVGYENLGNVATSIISFGLRNSGGDGGVPTNQHINGFHSIKNVGGVGGGGIQDGGGGGAGFGPGGAGAIGIGGNAGNGGLGAGGGGSVSGAAGVGGGGVVVFYWNSVI